MSGVKYEKRIEEIGGVDFTIIVEKRPGKDIPLHPETLKEKWRECPNCKVWFEAKHKNRKYCPDPACARERKRKYHKRDMQKRRDEDPVRYR
jgi:hypothetical protein